MKNLLQKKQLRHLMTLLFLTIVGIGVTKADTTYKLVQVTSVEDKGLYVFEQDGHVMNNTVSGSALQTTIPNKTEGLTGTESYVWKLEAATGGFYMKNVSLSAANYLTNTSSTNVSLANKENNNVSVWIFNFQNDGTCLIQNKNNNNRYLGYPNETSYVYKAYSTQSMGYPHAIKVYKLVEETGNEPKVVETPTFSPAAGAVVAGTEVSIRTTTKDAVIYYTTNGNTPSATSGTQGTTVTINDEVTIKAIAVKDGYEDSEVAEASYTIKPTISGYVVDFENNLDEYVDWTMTNIEQGTTTITAHGGTQYATTGGKETASIATKNAIATPYILTCYVTKQTNNTTASNWKIQVSSDGSTWTDVATQSATSMNAGTWVEFSANLSDYKNVFVRVYYDGTTAVRNIDDLTLLTEIPTIPIINANTPSELACDATSGSISYEIVNYETGTMVATTDVDWIKDFTYQTSENGSVGFTSTANPTATSRSAIVTLTYTYGDNQTTTTNITVSQEGNPNAPGTINTPYTVEQARAAIDAGTGTQGVYATGIVSEIVEAYNSQYGNISYNISTDGLTTSDQLEAYRGKAKNGANFTSADDIQVGDEVVIYGNLTKHNSTYEFAASNQLISLIRPEKPKHKVTFYQNGTKLSEEEISEDVAITFPDAEAEIYGKSFVGWTATAIDGTTETPTFVNNPLMGTADVTYYAVYASAEATGETVETKNQTLQYDTWTYSGTTTDKSSYRLFGNGSYIESAAFDLSKLSKVIVYGGTFGGGLYNSLTIGDGINTWKDVTVSGTSQTGTNTYTDGTTLTGTNKLRITATAGNGTTTGVRISKVEIFITEPIFVYSNYCTTVQPPIELAAPIIFHEAGEYEGPLTMAMAGQGTIKYKLGKDGAEQTYSTPFEINEDATITAWTEVNGVKSKEVTKTFTFAAAEAGPSIEDGYFTIMNNGNKKYVQVAGRKTVVFDDNTNDAGTVIRVKTNTEKPGQVEILRSQGIDIPGYAQRAMNYVPELVKAIVERLGENNFIGEPGLNNVATEFTNKFDYNLYLEKAKNDGEYYRIYGKTPSMTPVVDFYAKNKEVIDGRLPYLEGFVKDIFTRIADKIGHGQGWVDSFKIHDLWVKMGGTESGLTEPVDDDAAAISQFYTEILSSEKNVWNFAHETMMIYWGRVKEFLNGKTQDLGEYAKFIDKVEYIQPNFKYYIVQKDGQMDFISQENSDLITDPTAESDYTVWTLDKRTEFDVTLPIEKAVTIYPTTPGEQTISSNEYYGTLYTDFAFDLPDGVTAYKVEGINNLGTNAIVKKSQLTGTIPAQTPVLLIADKADLTLALNTNEGSAIESELHGNDWLINKYEINSSQAEELLGMLKMLSESLYENYEYLQRRNAGTVNNKYFFDIAVKPDLRDAYSAKTGNEMENTPVHVLSKNEAGKVAFIETWNPLAGNEGFIFSENEDCSEILLSLAGDVNRNGIIEIDDVRIIVDIILGRVTPQTHSNVYDFEAADANGDKVITIDDLRLLVDIILGRVQL